MSTLTSKVIPMKKLFLLIILVFGLLLLQASAQSRIVEKSFSIDDEDKIQLDLKFGDTITVKSWDKNKVHFRAVIEINSGRLNEALVFDFNNTNRRLDITSDYNEQELKNGRREDCPDSRYSHYSLNSEGHSLFVCSKIEYQIFMPGNADISVESISGDIELVGLTGPVQAKSISGYVDLSWPAGIPVDVSIKTISGEAYTDLDNLHIKNKKPHIPIVGYTLKGSIGAGGPRISLESVSGNVYLRKVKS